MKVIVTLSEIFGILLLIALICIFICTIIYNKIISPIIRRIKAIIYGIEVMVIDTGYMTGYGRVSRYRIDYKLKGQTKWQTYCYDIPGHRLTSFKDTLYLHHKSGLLKKDNDI